MYTLKVNIRAKEERERKEKERLAKEAIAKIQATAGPPSRPRKGKGLNFHEPGTFISQGEKLRKKAKLEALQKKIAEDAAKTGIADAVKLATLTTAQDEKKSVDFDVTEEVPDAEWWDQPILRNSSLEDVILRLDQKNCKPESIFDGITNLIEHPQILKPPGPDNSTVQIPIFLTKDERKKLRRQNRKNLELEKQEKIKLGLLPKPEPKLKRSNIMYTLGTEAITNPSMAEQIVREQQEKRLQDHMEHNESKKLSAEEKKAKNLKKIREDLDSTGTWASVYRVLDMSSPANKFKVTKNAKQLTMSGVLVLYKDVNIVVVEGGPKQQRRYKHLMLERIKWDNADPMLEGYQDSEKSTPRIANRCYLVWEGQILQKSLRGFKVKQFSEQAEARDFFKQLKLEHYWDLAFKMSILETIEDNQLSI